MEGSRGDEKPGKVRTEVRTAGGTFCGKGLRRESLGKGVQLCSEVRLDKTEKRPMETRSLATVNPAVLGMVGVEIGSKGEEVSADGSKVGLHEKKSEGGFFSF